MEFNIYQRLCQLYNSKRLLWVIISLGIVLRIIRYCYNPPLWFDEAVNAVDIIKRSLPEFMNPSPDYDGSYPFGFLILIKSAVILFNNTEYAFRLIPLIFGIMSILLFYRVSKQYINPEALPIALAFFAISDPLVLFSSEFKPYSVDLFFVLLIYILTSYVQAKELDRFRLSLFAVTGAITLWFSNPSVFVLAGVGTVMALSAMINMEWPKVRRLSIVFLIWAISFTALYFIYISKAYAHIGLGVEGSLKSEHAFMPVPPMSFGDVKWYIDNFFETFDYPVGVALPGVAAIAFLVGGVTVFSESRKKFFILMLPVFFTYFAALLHKYPFKGRLILFLVPLLILFMAEGVYQLWKRTRNGSVIIGAIIAGTLFVYPLMWAAYHGIKPTSRENIKPVLTYIKDNWQNGDILYVHYYSQFAFEYYTKYHPEPYNFKDNDYAIGIAPRRWYTRWKRYDMSKYYDIERNVIQSRTDSLREYAKDLDRLIGHKRVWILFTGDLLVDGVTEENFFLYHLETIGERIDSFGRVGNASVYLYDLSRDISEAGNN